MNTELAEKKAPMLLKDWVETDAVKNALVQVLPDQRVIGKFLLLARMSFNKTPALADCTKESVLQCLMACGQYGLLPDGRHAHLIPYGKECKMIIDYKGYIALAKRDFSARYGVEPLIFAEIVHEFDDFEIKTTEKGRVFNHVPRFADKGKVIGAYSFVKATPGSDADIEWMTEEDICSVKSRSKTGNVWKSDENEMRKKTVIRRHSKRWDISPEFAAAMAEEEFDDETRFQKAKPVASDTRKLFGNGTQEKADGLGTDCAGDPPSLDMPNKMPPKVALGIKIEEAAFNVPSFENFLRSKALMSAAQTLKSLPEGIAESILADWNNLADEFVAKMEKAK